MLNGKIVASKTADLAGDGTTTATVLLKQWSMHGYEIRGCTGANPMDLKEELSTEIVKAVVDELKINLKTSVMTLAELSR